MSFKSHLAVLVLGLCELHLIGSANNNEGNLVIKNNNKHKKVHTISHEITQDETAPHIQPTSITWLTSKDKSQGPTTIHPASNDKDKTFSATHPASNDKDKTFSATHPASNNKDNTVSTTHPTSNDEVFTTQPNTDNARSTTKLPKKSTLKGDTTSHPGGSAATIPSMFTIASLMCVLLL